MNKFLKALSLPQKTATNYVANQMGIRPQASSEDANFEIVQKVAEKIGEKTGANPNSTAANILKSLAVAGSELALDPTNLVPGSSIAKVAKNVPRLVKAVKGSSAIESALSKLKKAKEAGEVVGKQTGVDSRSFNALREAIQRKMENK